MPCNCDHLKASELEKECAKILNLLDEIYWGVKTYDYEYGNGYDTRIYNKVTREIADKLIARLCREIKNIPKDQLLSYSENLQCWADEHELIDKKKKNNDKPI